MDNNQAQTYFSRSLNNTSKQLLVFLNTDTANLFFISADRSRGLKLKDSINVSLQSSFSHLQKAFSDTDRFIM